MSTLKTSLLAERDSILKELESVESLLRSRFGWRPPKQQKPAQNSSKTEDTDTSASQPWKVIHYADEVKTWLDGMTCDKTFTVKDFRNQLAEKYGEDNVNISSIRGPFSRMENSGEIVVVRRGTGRAPTFYKKGPANDEDAV